MTRCDLPLIKTRTMFSVYNSIFHFKPHLIHNVLKPIFHYIHRVRQTMNIKCPAAHNQGA